MRLLHLADLHLGQVYGHFDRLPEQEAVLGQILQIIEERRVDALLVAGDVFHRVHPPARAVRMWYRFLSEAQRRQPTLEVVAVAGNHDPVARFEVAEPFARPQGIQLVARLARRDSGALDPQRVLVPLHDATGRPRAVCVAVPFLRPADLRCDASQPGWLRAGVEAVYAEAFELAREAVAAAATQGHALGVVATGHLEVAGTAVTSEAELRTPFDGAESPSAAALFPTDLAYVALGHVHLPQAVGGRENVRYAGSPLPLSMSEVGYAHQAVLVELDAQGTFAGYESCKLTPPVEMIRVPRSAPGRAKAAPLGDVLVELDATLAEASAAPNATPKQWPYLAVHVLDEPSATDCVRERVEAALEGKAARLVQIRRERPSPASPPATSSPGADQERAPTLPAFEPQSLAELDPEEVFTLCYDRAQATSHPGENHNGSHGNGAAEEIPVEMRAYLRELIAEARERLTPSNDDALAEEREA